MRNPPPEIEKQLVAINGLPEPYRDAMKRWFCDDLARSFVKAGKLHDGLRCTIEALLGHHLTAAEVELVHELAAMIQTRPSGY